MSSDNLKIANKKFKSRLIVGTGKYKNMEECSKAIKISGAEIVTVAVRRVNISDKSKPLLMDYIDPKKIMYLPNTAGCFTSKEALRTLRLAREIGGRKIVKLEVLEIKKIYFLTWLKLKSTEVLSKKALKWCLLQWWSINVQKIRKFRCVSNHAIGSSHWIWPRDSKQNKY